MLQVAGDGAAERGDVLSGLLDLAEHPAGVGKQRAAGLGEVDAAVAAVEQRGAGVGLERLDLHGDRGLGDPHRPRGVGERSALDDGDEGAQLGDVHARLSSVHSAR